MSQERNLSADYRGRRLHLKELFIGIAVLAVLVVVVIGLIHHGSNAVRKAGGKKDETFTGVKFEELEEPIKQESPPTLPPAPIPALPQAEPRMPSENAAAPLVKNGTEKQTTTPSLPAALPKTETTRYVVKKGDTLPSIAAKVYGPGDTEGWRRIYQRNLARINGAADEIYPGLELIIPPLEPTGSKSAPEPEAGPAPDSPQQLGKEKIAEKKAATPDGSLPPKTRAYTVKKGDSFHVIAQRELGEAALWKQVYELNKSRIRDPNLIRPGMTIELPATTKK